MSFAKVGDDYDSILNFPGDSVVKNLPVNIGDTGLIPGLGGSTGEGNSYPLQYSCLENPMDRWLQSMGLQRVRQDCNWAHDCILRGLSIYHLSDHLRMPANTSLMVLWKGAHSTELKPLTTEVIQQPHAWKDPPAQPRIQMVAAPTDNLTTVSQEILSQNNSIKPLLDSWLSGDVITQKQLMHPHLIWAGMGGSVGLQWRSFGASGQAQRSYFWSLRLSPEAWPRFFKDP